MASFPEPTPSIALQLLGLSTSRADAAANSVKLAAAVALAQQNNVILYGYPAVIPVNAELDCTVDFQANGMTLDATGATGAFANSAVYYASGSATSLGSLASQANANSNTIVLSSSPPPSVVPGSIISIVDKTSGSFNAARPNYYNGEDIVVESVSGSTITTQNPLLFTYPTAHLGVVKVNLINAANPKIYNLNVIGVAQNSGVVPITLNFCGPGTILDNCFGTQSAEGGILIQYGYGVVARSCRGDTSASVLAGINYGLVIGNSAYVRVVDGYFVGGRHGTTIGGADSDFSIVNYACGFTGNDIFTVAGQPAPVPAADMHGNCYHCYYRGNFIVGGLEFGGKNECITDNDIITGSALGLSQYAISSSESNGAENDCHGNHIRVYSNSANLDYAAGIDLDSPNGLPNVTDAGTFNFSGTQMQYYVASGSTASVYQVAGLSVIAGNIINVDLSNSTFKLLGVDSGATANGCGFGVSGSGTWGRITLSGIKGDIGFDIRGAANVMASGVALGDISGANFNSSLVAFSIGSAISSIYLSGISLKNGNSFAALIFGTSGSPQISVNGFSTPIGSFTGQSYPIEVSQGASAGTGAIVHIDNYHIGTGGILIGANVTSAWFGAGEVAADYNLGTLANIGTVTANGATPVAAPNTLITQTASIALTPNAGQTGKGAFVSSITAGTGFSINSTAGDTSTYNYKIASR